MRGNEGFVGDMARLTQRWQGEPEPLCKARRFRLDPRGCSLGEELEEGPETHSPAGSQNSARDFCSLWRFEIAVSGD